MAMAGVTVQKTKQGTNQEKNRMGRIMPCKPYIKGGARTPNMPSRRNSSACV
jgi:hypothetical protein